MGAIADALMAYARPLLEGTDGSPEEMQRALSLSTLCYNLALVPEDKREDALAEFRSKGGMNEEQFVEFRRDVIDPMIRRHEAMFPGLHNRVIPGALAARPATATPAPAQPQPRPGDPYPGTDRYAPCPCGSGEKYKFCCGKKGR